MTDEKDVYIKVDIASFQDMCKRIGELEAKNKDLTLENDFLRHENEDLTATLNSITNMSMFEFGNTYCSQESLEADGHALARSLLGDD